MSHGQNLELIMGGRQMPEGIAIESVNSTLSAPFRAVSLFQDFVK